MAAHALLYSATISAVSPSLTRWGAAY